MYRKGVGVINKNETSLVMRIGGEETYLGRAFAIEIREALSILNLAADIPV